MAHLFEEHWRSLNRRDQKEVLKGIYCHVVSNLDSYPAFMTERDRNDLTSHAIMDCSSWRQKFWVHLDIEIFAYRYFYFTPECPNFPILVEFLQSLTNNIRVGDLQLFERCDNTEYMRMYLDFNMQAVFLWMFHHEWEARAIISNATVRRRKG